MTELDAVAAVARLGGFRAAAIELGMSSSALSNAVAGLEARLGVRLFNRTTRSVSLSAAGEEFIALIAPALGDIHEAMAAVGSHRSTPAGQLRLNCPVGAARRFLMPVVLEYLRRLPDMRVEVTTEDRLIDIVRDGFDAGIRTRDILPADMVAVPFGPPVRFVVVGTPAYFAARGHPETPAELMAHRCIRARLPGGAIYRWEFERHGQASTIDVPGALTLGEGTLIREAALADAGLAYLWEATIEADIAAGRLVPTLAAWTPPAPGLCLYHPGRRHVPAALSAFIALLRETHPARDYAA